MRVSAALFICLCFATYSAAHFLKRDFLLQDKLEKVEGMRADMLSVRMMTRDLDEASLTDPNAPNIPAKASELGLTTLVDYVTRAGLAGVLSGTGPFTVFGPTNKAFEALPKEVKEALMANTTLLADVLKYHVLSGKVASSALKNELLADTVQGSKLRINIYPNVNVYTAQCSAIDLKEVDQVASNGLIHVLKRVMFIPMGNIVQTAAAEKHFKTLVTAVKAASLVEALSGPGPFTLFAPTDAAFKKLPPGTLEKLLANPTQLAAVLKYHVVSGTYCSAGLSSGKVPTLNGADVNVVVGSGGVTVNEANVVSADLSVTNGVVHAIDAVLLPPGLDL